MTRPIIRRSRVASNTGWNLAGVGVPALIAFAAIPLLIRDLGADRFGVLALVWGLVGYFTFLDLGLGNAVTRAAARRVGKPGAHWIPTYAWTGVAAAAALGVAAGAALAAVAPWAVRSAMSVPTPLQAEAITALQLVAAVLPLVTSTSVLRGVLEAHQRFALVNVIRVPLGVLTFAGPLAVLPYTTNLGWVVAVLAGVRAAGWVAHLALCLRVIPAMRARPALRPRAARALVRYGGWTTVTGVAGALMSYLDRFLIAAMLPLAAVAYYVTPFDAMLRVAMIPGALCAAMFPAMAERFRRPDRDASALFEWGGRAMILALFPAMLLVVSFAPEALTAWVGSEFAREGALVLQWLAVGVFVFGVGLVAASAVGAAGRPDLSAKLNVLELPLYLAVLYVAIQQWGIAGAAVAWTLRLALDAGLLLWMLGRVVPIAVPASRRLLGALSFSSVLLVVGLLPETLSARAAVGGLSLTAFCVVAWGYLLPAAERSTLARRILGRGATVPGRP